MNAIRWRQCLLVFLLGAGLISLLQTTIAYGKKPPAPPDEESAAIQIGPYLQNATPNSMVVMWETGEGEETIVEYGVTESLGDIATGDTLVLRKSCIHQAELTSLSPDTIYFYRVRTGTASSDVYHFRTPPLPSSESAFRFTVYSDAQIDKDFPNMHREIVNDGIIATITADFGPDIASELAFNLVVGDLVDKGDSTRDWTTFFSEMFNLGVQVPYYTVLGNHEYDDDNYFNFMDNPHNGDPAYDEHWYYVDYSNVRIIGLDSNTYYRIQEQLDWLDGVLTDAETNDHIDFVFAQLHHPYLSELWVPGEIDYTGEVIARLEDFSNRSGKPSIHFHGHTHGYARGQSRDAAHNWICVASAEGDLDYWGEYENADYEELQISLPEWGFLLIEVTAGDDPSFHASWISRGNEMVARDNEVRDEFTIWRYTEPPDQPIAESPAFDPLEPMSVDPAQVILQGSPFFDPDGDGSLESHFQITTVSQDYTIPLVERWIRFENFYAPPGATERENGYYSVNTVTDWESDVTHTLVTDLPFDTDLYWRVRYRDDSMQWSDWSEETHFVTAPDFGN